MARFFLADPSLLTVSGHCFGYLNSLVRPLDQLGYRTLLLGNKGVDRELQRTYNVVPMFTYWCDTRVGTPYETWVAHTRAICQDLTEVVRIFGAFRSDVFLLNTLRHWPLLGVMDWLEAIPPRERPVVVLVFHFTAFPNPQQSDGTVDIYRQCFQRFETSPARSRLLLMADSEDLVQEYREVNDRLPFVVAPIPHSPRPQARNKVQEGRLQFGYIGEARQNKGFDLLPYLWRRILDSGYGEEVALHVQSFCFNQGAEFYRRVMPRLLHPNITLYPEKLSDAEYYDFLDRMDVVLLPYTTDNYHAQTSGVFAEAMALGKIVVVPRGTWMARQVAHYGGGLAFNPGDQEDFARQVLQVLHNRKPLADAAAQRVEPWCAFHGSEPFLQMITQFANKTAA